MRERIRDDVTSQSSQLSGVVILQPMLQLYYFNLSCILHDIMNLNLALQWVASLTGTFLNLC